VLTIEAVDTQRCRQTLEGDISISILGLGTLAEKIIADNLRKVRDRRDRQIQLPTGLRVARFVLMGYRPIWFLTFCCFLMGARLYGGYGSRLDGGFGRRAPRQTDRQTM
jgi:hypothetical protein